MGADLIGAYLRGGANYWSNCWVGWGIIFGVWGPDPINLEGSIVGGAIY